MSTLTKSKIQKKQKVFFDIAIDNIHCGRIVFELFSDILPKTCANFYHLCVGDRGVGRDTNRPLTYNGCLFHRVVKGFIAQSGDFSHNNGIGGESIYGGKFEDEGFPKRHFKRGMLSMANSGKNSNGSQFFITFTRTPFLDNKHVAFGHIKSGMEVLGAIESVPTDRNNRPMGEVRIERCGDVETFEKIEKEIVQNEYSSAQNEIIRRKKETIEILSHSEQKKEQKETIKPISDKKSVSSDKETTKPDVIDGDDNVNDNKKDGIGPDLSKLSAREKKFYDLKQKFISSSRHTKKEVMKEYRQSDKNKNNAKKITAKNTKKSGKTWKKSKKHYGAITAAEAERFYEKRAAAKNRDSGMDLTFNAYLRTVERLGHSTQNKANIGADGTELISCDRNDLKDEDLVSDSREKIDQLSKDIIETQEKKRKFSRRRKYNEERDISFINRRNEAFNAKVARAFDKYTFEIRGNLERGTAL